MHIKNPNSAFNQMLGLNDIFKITVYDKNQVLTQKDNKPSVNKFPKTDKYDSRSVTTEDISKMESHNTDNKGKKEK